VEATRAPRPSHVDTPVLGEHTDGADGDTLCVVECSGDVKAADGTQDQERASDPGVPLSATLPPDSDLPPATEEGEASPSRHPLSWFGAAESLKGKLQALQLRSKQVPLTVGESSELQRLEAGQAAFEKILPKLQSAQILDLRDIPRMPRGPKDDGSFNFYLPSLAGVNPGKTWLEHPND
jgi:hypothetical protein